MLKFIEGDVSDRVLAEFSIDLEKRAVTPAGTVISEEEDPPFDTVIGFQKGPEENGYSVEAVALTSNGRESTGLVQFTTQSGSRKKPERLRVEVRDSQGNLLFASDSVTEAGLGVWNEEEWTTAVADIDAPPDADPVAYGVNTREIGFAGSVEELQGERVTTTVTSLQSGEVLCTDTRVLDVLQSGR